MKRTAEATERTRQAVLDAALWVFAEKGWDGTTLDEVARRAGVTRGAVYHHWRNKASLLLTVLEEYWAAAALPEWRRLAAPEESAQRRLAEFLGTYLRLLAEDDRFRALAIVTVTVAPRVPVDDADAGHKHATLASWTDTLGGVFAEIGDPLPSGLAAAEAAEVLMTMLYGATTLAGTSLPAGPTAPVTVAPAIVYGLTQGAPTPP